MLCHITRPHEYLLNLCNLCILNSATRKLEFEEFGRITKIVDYHIWAQVLNEFNLI